jgi:hypothetical protein
VYAIELRIDDIAGDRRCAVSLTIANCHCIGEKLYH